MSTYRADYGVILIGGRYRWRAVGIADPAGFVATGLRIEGARRYAGVLNARMGDAT